MKLAKRAITACICFLLILCSLLLVSCSSKAPELYEVKDRFVYLIEQSAELNVLFFGAGLPVYRRGSAISDKKMVYFAESIGGYDYITEEADFVTIDDMKKKAEGVYSEGYLTDVYEGAFDGILTGNTGAYLRFYDDGKNLYQNTTLHNFTVNERIYDYSTMEIVKPSSADYINVTIESYSIADSKRETVNLSFTFERGNWYLDSPTY